MGTLNFTVVAIGRNKEIQSSGHGVSGAASTSGSEGAVSGLTTQAGQIVKMIASEDMWVRFGATAAVGTGHPLAAGVPEWFEIELGTQGAVSAIDVS